MCELAEVSRSGYYEWLEAEPYRQKREEADKADFEQILEAYKYRGYAKGARSIYMRLLHLDIVMNLKKIRRLMHKYGLKCPYRGPNPYRQMAKSLKTNTVFPNKVDRKFLAGGVRKERLLLMNRISQEARKKQAIVKYSLKNGKSKAAEQYGVSLSSVKRWCKRYDGTWESLKELPHTPHSHPKRHTPEEERKIKKAFKKYFERYGWDGVYTELKTKHYTRSFSGMVYAAKRMGLTAKPKTKKKNKEIRRYPEIMIPGEKVQIDVKEVPFNCLRGEALRNNRHFYQWTAIDECTRMRFVYGFEEHTPENTVKFLKMLIKVFPFRIRTIQTDNGTEFTYKFISSTEICPFDKVLKCCILNTN